jgi:membrane protease YdiL (CAAX protease family)
MSSAPPDVESLSTLGRDERTGLWRETVVVLLVGVVPFFAWSVFANIWPRFFQTVPLPYDALNRMVFSLQAMAPALYFMLWSPHLRADGGFRQPHAWDLPIGLGIGLAGWLAWRMVELNLPSSAWRDLAELDPRLPPSSPPPQTWVEHSLVVAYLVLGGLSEEIVLRGCLLPRFEKLLNSTLCSLLLTSVLFGTHYAYQGGLGVLDAFVGGLVYGGFYCWLRRIWPIALAHAGHELAFQYW